MAKPRTYGRNRRGGARQGTPGENYQNRSDLQGGARQPATAATGQTYGNAGAQIAAQKAVPMAGTPGIPAPQGPPQLATYPGDHGPFDRPTERPDEPVTAGIGAGPGAGPEAMTTPPNDTLSQLRAIYSAFPDESLREILEDLESGG